jgi:hypothetical protein
VYFFVECPALGKAIFAECLTLPRAALGKEPLSRVSDIWHSVKHMTLGKDAVSGSAVRRLLPVPQTAESTQSKPSMYDMI